MDTDTDLNILTYFRCITHNRSRLGQSWEVTPCAGVGGGSGGRGCVLRYTGPLCDTAETHTLESNSPPVWKSHALCTLDEASVYRGCLQAAILATSPIMPTDVFHLRGALL